MGALPHHVRRGRIGIVGPAGSASDEIAVRIHDFTAGVSRMVAVPADDLACADGARATTDAVAALESDDDTDVVVVVAVAAHPVAADALLKRAARSAKPVVVCLIGASPETIAAGEADGVTVLSRTKPAALAAVEAAGVDSSTLDLHALNWPLIHEVRGLLHPEQTGIRALFASEALCAEAAYLAAESHPDVRTDLGLPGLGAVDPAEPSRGHVFLARARSGSPIVDPGLRVADIRGAAEDPRTGVIVLDFVLGDDAHPDPVGAILPAIAEAKASAAVRGRHLEVLGYLMGTDADPQGYATQATKLDDAGITWASSSTNTGLLAREFVVKA